MNYEIQITETFSKWFKKLDKVTKSRLLDRLARVERGVFGDFKEIENNLFELRCFFAGGIRLYYTIRGNTIVLILVGGIKDTQVTDIKKAKAILENIED